MIEILDHFDNCENDYELECEILKLKRDEIEEFISKLPLSFRRCYLTDKELKKNLRILKINVDELISNYIPDKSNIMSGEFGEILSFLILKERCHPLMLLAPKKWLWKSDRNKPMQYTDVILLHMKTRKPDKEDFLISAEVKTKSKAKRSYRPIDDAVAGSIKDSVSRLAVTLCWLREKYIKTANIKGIRYLDRFIESPQFGEYKKQFKAIAVLDKKLLESELEVSVELLPTNNQIEILVIAVDGLKAVFERIYKNIAECAI